MVWSWPVTKPKNMVLVSVMVLNGLGLEVNDLGVGLFCRWSLGVVNDRKSHFMYHTTTIINQLLTRIHFVLYHRPLNVCTLIQWQYLKVGNRRNRSWSLYLCLAISVLLPSLTFTLTARSIASNYPEHIKNEKFTKKSTTPSQAIPNAKLNFPNQHTHTAPEGVAYCAQDGMCRC